VRRLFYGKLSQDSCGEHQVATYVTLNGRRAYFHRPHPQREALIYRVKAAREFLIKLEITP
jgi:hypothetical protein